MARRIIIKLDGTKKEFPAVYLMGKDEKDCTYGGILRNETITCFIEAGILKEVPHIEIMEKYFNHAGFLADCSHSTYYEIKQSIK